MGCCRPNLDHLQQGILDAFARYFPAQGDVLARATNLVDLVDVDVAPLRRPNVPFSRLEQLDKHLSHVPYL